MISPGDAGSTRIEVRYRQREGGSGELGVDYTAQGLRYTVEASTDLQTWTPYTELPAIGSNSSRDSHGNGIETVNLELLIDQTLHMTPKVFIRLNVSIVP